MVGQLYMVNGRPMVDGEWYPMVDGEWYPMVDVWCFNGG